MGNVLMVIMGHANRWIKDSAYGEIMVYAPRWIIQMDFARFVTKPFALGVTMLISVDTAIKDRAKVVIKDSALKMTRVYVLNQMPTIDVTLAMMENAGVMTLDTVVIKIQVIAQMATEENVY